MDKKFFLNRKNESNECVMPLIVGMPITTRCNLSCEHCLRNNNKTIADYIWDMSMKEAKVLASKFKGKCKFVNLSAGYGEPFLNKNINYIFEVFRQENLATIIYTNGKLLNKTILSGFFSDYFIISIDLFHYKNIYDLLSRFKDLITLADDLNYIFTNKFIISCVIDSNIENYELVKSLCELQITHPKIFIEFHWRMIYNDKPSVVNKIDVGYLELENKYRSPHIEFPTFMHYQNNHCGDLWKSAYFDHNGNFRGCCVFYDTYRALNIFKMSLEDIWTSDVLNYLRNRWRECDGFEKCKQCPIGYGNVNEWR